MNNKLTGRQRFRKNWRGKLILQVEYWDKCLASNPFDGDEDVRMWRDARIEDRMFVDTHGHK